ncbi:hypothetical protein DFP72DRAFT_807270 [Ephemerocybe angulata]|uniref:Uncharacterized protein n=1 Tax=Ephemerocybe angulata TaxID=980116 RepID=A0A8H6M7S0_9AGAR|nr:hypothetical protein DFP72DRAFT_807270 [Tulosesus angulatus]
MVSAVLCHLGQEYLEEVALPLDNWFWRRTAPLAHTPGPIPTTRCPFSLDLLSTKSNTIVTGSVQLKLGFVASPNCNEIMRWEAVYWELSKRSRPSLVSAPAVRRRPHSSSDAPF